MNTELVAESTAVLARHGRSFSLAGQFLAPAQRGDAALLYAFCRLADDLVDETTDAEQARRDIAALRAELKDEQPARPLVQEVQRILAPIGRKPALDLLDGVVGDLDFQAPEDDDALHLYCYQVAGTVGLMMCAVLGVQERAAYTRALDLGLGMQLTNICRDVAEDAANGRVYLPRQRLEAAGLTGAMLLEGTADRDAVAGVVRDLLVDADRFYASARNGYPAIPLRSRVAIALAGRLYQGIGHKLARHGGDALAGRTVVGPFEKLWLLGRGTLDLVTTAPDEPTRSARFLEPPNPLD